MLAPVHIGNSEGDILKQLDALNPKLILTHDSDTQIKDVSYPLMKLEIGSELAEQESNSPSNTLSSEESLRIYTSGSTGTPQNRTTIASKLLRRISLLAAKLSRLIVQIASSICCRFHTCLSLSVVCCCR